MINSDKLISWAGGVGGGKVVNLLSEYAESQNPDLTMYYFKELVGLVAGPAAVGVAWKLSKDPRHERKADAIGLMGVEMFIDRIVKLGAEQFGVVGSRPVRRVITRAPPPGLKASSAPGHWPYARQERLPFQSDITW